MVPLQHAGEPPALRDLRELDRHGRGNRGAHLPPYALWRLLLGLHQRGASPRRWSRPVLASRPHARLGDQTHRVRRARHGGRRDFARQRPARPARGRTRGRHGSRRLEEGLWPLALGDTAPGMDIGRLGPENGSSSTPSGRPLDTSRRRARHLADLPRPRRPTGDADHLRPPRAGRPALNRVLGAPAAPPTPPAPSAPGRSRG